MSETMLQFAPERFLPKLPTAEELKPPTKLSDFKRIVLTTDHRSIAEALIADVFDLVPGVGEIAGFLKGQDAASRGKRACGAALTGDIILADVIPANLLCYIVQQFKVEVPKPMDLPNLPELFP